MTANRLPAGTIPGLAQGWPHTEHGPWYISPFFAQRGGRLHCVAVSVAWDPVGGPEMPHPERADEPPDQTFAKVLRRLPIKSLIERSRQKLDDLKSLDLQAARYVDNVRQRFDADSRRRAEQNEEHRTRIQQRQAEIYAKTTAGRGRPAVSGAHLKRVANLYRELCKLQYPAPRQAIADEWDVKPSTASRWIGLARERGYLGAAVKPGQPGERST